MNEINVGDKVKFIDAEAHKINPLECPAAGTIGVIKFTFISVAHVQWPAGSTSGNNSWHARSDQLKKA